MPFKKGHSGRPKGARNRANQTVGLSLADLGGPNGKAYAQQLHAIATGVHDDVHARLKALSIIVPYVWGKPTEHIEHSGEISLPTKVTFELHQ